MKNFYNKYNKYIVAICFITVGFLSGMYLKDGNPDCNKSSFKFINPDLFCNYSQVVEKNSYIKLKHELSAFIQDKKDDNTVSDVSIYFRDLDNGPTLGINEQTLFSPASLLKMPLMLTFYNLANDEGSDVLNKKIKVLPNNSKLIQMVKPKEYAEIGKEYTVSQLIEYMIKHSDNNSYYALLDYLYVLHPERDLLSDTFVDLGIVDPKSIVDNTISVKSYGSIFTQLYNSSYFNSKDNSEKALNLLSESDYADGIVNGIPKGLIVAHKFGERTNVEGDLAQLHDCGIVYYPGNPYLLCVMTRGKDFSKLPSVISEISNMVYTEFDSRKL